MTRIWPDHIPHTTNLEPSKDSEAEQFALGIRALKPQSEDQRWLHMRSRDLAEKLLDSRWLIFSSQTSSVQLVFISILVCWLTFIFTTFGLFAPRNGTVVTVMFVCAASVAGAVFLILELDGPYDGRITVSPDPMRFALKHMNR